MRHGQMSPGHGNPGFLTISQVLLNFAQIHLAFIWITTGLSCKLGFLIHFNLFFQKANKK